MIAAGVYLLSQQSGSIKRCICETKSSYVNEQWFTYFRKLTSGNFIDESRHILHSFAVVQGLIIALRSIVYTDL